MTRCSSILNGAGYLCYAAETALPIAAACTNKSSLTYATLPFAFLGTVFFCWRLTSTYRTPGVHNLAHLIGLGTSIASAAVNAGSVAFKILTSLAAGAFGGNITIELFEAWNANNWAPPPVLQGAPVVYIEHLAAEPTGPYAPAPVA